MCKKVQNNLYLKLLVLLFIISQAPLIGYPSGQDGPILPAWDFPFDPSKKDFVMASQNTAKESQNKENIDKFRDFILEQKPTNTKVKTQSDMKAWKQLSAQSIGFLCQRSKMNKRKSFTI